MTQLIPDKPEQKRITAFHADDHELFRLGVKRSLAAWPEIDISRGVGNGKELLILLKKEIPDVVLLDINMPVMNGIKALIEMKKKYPYLKVIVLTMLDDREMVREMMQLGANSFISANSSKEILSQAIRCVHEFNYYYSESMEQAFLDPVLQFERLGRKYTVKEQQILDLLAQDKSESEIAKIMDISKRTVATVIERLNRRRHNRE